MSRETVHHTDGREAAAGVRGAVIVAHGGTEVSTEPVSPLDPAVLRMIPLALAIRRALRGTGVMVVRPRYRVRGWNGELASPVPDLGEVLDGIGLRFGRIPVVLIGHSMGARAAFRVAGPPGGHGGRRAGALAAPAGASGTAGGPASPPRPRDR